MYSPSMGIRSSPNYFLAISVLSLVSSAILIVFIETGSVFANVVLTLFWPILAFFVSFVLFYGTAHFIDETNLFTFFCVMLATAIVSAVLLFRKELKMPNQVVQPTSLPLGS
jgi:hypothetical protein